jgi:murein DD-endopeptidase MepM/ murein hydrolase activator NlpD
MQDVLVNFSPKQTYINLQSNLAKHKINSSEPNFILVGINPSQKSFGDFQEALSFVSEINIKINTFNSESKLFLNFVSSFILQVFNSVAYYTYCLVISLLEIATALPKWGIELKKYLTEVLDILKSSETRELWFLNQKLVAKSWIFNVQETLKGLYILVSKFYLLILSLLIVGGLNFSASISQPKNSVNNQKLKEGSLLSKVFDRNSASLALNLEKLEKQTPVTQIASNNNVVDTTDAYLYLPKIIEHQVKSGEDVQTIANLYNVSTDSITFNNNIESSDKIPEKLNIPFRDGLIYTLSKDLAVEDLSEAFKVDPNLIYSENEGDLDRETGKFTKDSQVLIPDVDFSIVLEAEKELEKEIIDVNKPLVDRKTNSSSKSKSTSKITPTPKNTFENQISTDRNDLGFIWPTTGRISRCVIGSHIACDIANKDEPPVYSVASGKVIAGGYGYEPGGYGNALMIDHGDGVVTLYAHLSEIYVQVGDSVSQGQSIGRMGRTGRSTGVHLHFEVRVNGVKKNPLNYLPK